MAGADNARDGVTVRAVHTRRDLSTFIKVPHHVFHGDAAWIPPLHLERRMHLSPRHNAYFQHARWQGWVAYKHGRPVGRISAQIDELEREHHGVDRGQFGFLDAIDDPAVFAVLLEEAESWLMREGARRVRGPFNLSINQECGLLVDGFEHPPMVMMGHGRPYYQDHLRTRGYQTAKDLLAFWIERDIERPPALKALTRRYAERIKLRPLDRDRIEEEFELLRTIFNRAWSKNWGFVPFTEAEFAEIGKQLRVLVGDDLVKVAEMEGSPAAFIVCIPNINEAIRDLGGRLLPFGWLKALWRLSRKRVTTGRIALMGVLPEHQESRVGAALALTLIDAIVEPCLDRGITKAELSWVLEDNVGLLSMLEAIGAHPYKRYRIFEKALEGPAP